MQNSIIRRLFLVAMLSSFVTTSGCEEDALKVSINVSDDNFCSEIAEVTCHNAFQCCTGLELEAIYGIEITTTEGECRRDIKLMCENTNSELIYAIEIGTATLATEAVEACLNALLAPNDVCFPYMSQDELMEACTADMIIGNQSSGSDCLFDFECEENAYCGPDRNCASLPTEGDSCPTGQCASDLYCSGGICNALLSSGETCFWSAECAEGLYCSEAGTCASLLGLGDSCTSNENCDSGFCLPGVCEGYGNECFSASDCNGTWGFCSTSGDYCYDDYDCDYYYGETCDGAAPGNCMGTPICADNWSTLNYCAINPLGMF